MFIDHNVHVYMLLLNLQCLSEPDHLKAVVCYNVKSDIKLTSPSYSVNGISIQGCNEPILSFFHKSYTHDHRTHWTGFTDSELNVSDSSRSTVFLFWLYFHYFIVSGYPSVFNRALNVLLINLAFWGRLQWFWRQFHSVRALQYFYRTVTEWWMYRSSWTVEDQ